MEQLVSDKVDTFWKGIEGGVNKRGQVRVHRVLNLLQPTNWILMPVDHRHVLGKTTQKVLVSSIHGRRGCPMGAVVGVFPSYCHCYLSSQSKSTG